jgi:ABC-2 type transport system ATP-binding protein
VVIDQAFTRTDDVHAPDVAMLRCQHLHKSFGALRAVDDVSLEISAGETYGLLGPNGAGKTTLISMVAGVLEADDGSATVDGIPMNPRSLAAKSRIGYVPQDIALYPDLSGRENLSFFAALYRLGRRAAKARVAEVLDVVDLTDRAADKVQTYSGGMKRRLNIAVGLIHRPRLLILDEPTVGVDPQSRNAILHSIEELSVTGMAVLYTTHYMEEAERLCDRIGIVDRGQLIAEGTTRELTARLGEAQHIELTVDGDPSRLTAVLSKLRVASKVTSGAGLVDVLVRDAAAALPAVLAEAAGAGSLVRSVTVRQPDLETVFLDLTGRRLRD